MLCALRQRRHCRLTPAEMNGVDGLQFDPPKAWRWSHLRATATAGHLSYPLLIPKTHSISRPFSLSTTQAEGNGWSAGWDLSVGEISMDGWVPLRRLEQGEARPICSTCDMLIPNALGAAWSGSRAGVPDTRRETRTSRSSGAGAAARAWQLRGAKGASLLGEVR